MSTILGNRITTQALRSLQSNPASKLLFVNMAGIVLPRIYIDFHRNKYAGQETAFYELYSTATNYALPGALGLGTAYLLGKVDNRFGIQTTNWLNNQYINALSDTYQNALKPGQQAETQKGFITDTLKKLQVKHQALDHSGTLQPRQIDQYVERFQTLFKKNKLDSSLLKELALNLAKNLGSFDQIKWGEHDSLSVHPEKLIEHLYILNREFQKGHLGTNLGQIQENIAAISQKLRFTNTCKSVVSVGLVAGLGFGAQFINKWITQRRTGKTGFVGYSDFEANRASASVKKSKPKASEGQNIPIFYRSYPGAASPSKPLYNPFVSPSAMGRMSQPAKIGFRVPAYPDVHAPNRSHNNAGQPLFGGLVSSQFLPTAEQLKYLIYPAGIVGKLAASRCLDEFRETATKGGFAYINFLLLPNLVENLVALSMRNSHVFSHVPQDTPANATGIVSKLKSGYQWISQTQVRSYSDIDVYAKQVGQRLGQLNDHAKIRAGLKGVVQNAEPLMQKLTRIKQSQWAKHIALDVSQELNRVKNIASICGLLYSCLTLGVGLNLLNIYITNKRRAKLQKALPKPALSSPMPPRSHPVWVAPDTVSPFRMQYQLTPWGYPQFTS